jgi:non-specific serine/threonine protein kinase
LFGAAERVRTAAAEALEPASRARYEDEVAAVRAALGDEAFTTAWAAGRAQPAAEIVVEALSDPGNRARDGAAAPGAPIAPGDASEAARSRPSAGARRGRGGASGKAVTCNQVHDQDGSPGGRLTAREQEIATLVAQGLTNRQIAAELSIALRTVDTHVSRVLRKLGVASRAELGDRMPEQRTPGTRAGQPSAGTPTHTYASSPG